MIDARELPEGQELRCQVCVIGTGPAGATVALELDGSGLDVLVLEGGGAGYGALAQDTYRGSVPLGGEHDPLENVRQKRLGGTSTQWGGRLNPLDPEDFERRPWIPNSGWPISAEDLAGPYERATELCGGGRSSFRAESIAGRSRFVFDDPSARVSDDRLWRWGPPVRFDRVLTDALDSMADTRLVVNANATRLQLDPVSGAVKAAIVSPEPGRELSVVADRYVLAMGALETARLLLHSGLDAASPALGRYYMTHPVGEIGRLELFDPTPASVVGYERTDDGVYCRRMLQVRPEIRRDLELANMGVSFWYPDPRDPDHGDGLLSAYALTKLALVRGGQWKASGVQGRYGETSEVGRHLANVARDLPTLVRTVPSWLRARYFADRAIPSFHPPPKTGLLRLRFDAENRPELTNRVTLSRRRDAYGVPRLAIEYRVGDEDRNSIVRSARVIAAELERSGLARVEMPEAEDLMREYRFGDGTHNMGTARMSASPRDGVVTRDLTAHESPNLSVVGSAVFPTSGFAGPTLTIVALAVRLAARISTESSQKVTVR